MESKTIQGYFEITGLGNGNKKNFYILNNKKSGRSIIFERGNKKVLGFMKNKLDSPIKKIIYFLIKSKLLSSFLPKIKLDSSVGQLVFLEDKPKYLILIKR